MSAYLQLRGTAARLRRALSAGSCAAAEALLPEYSRRLETVLGGLDPSAPETLEIAREARDLLEWTRRMALGTRAQAVAQLARFPATPPRAPYRRSRHTWALDA